MDKVRIWTKHQMNSKKGWMNPAKQKKEKNIKGYFSGYSKQVGQG